MVRPIKRGSLPFFEAQYRAVCRQMSSVNHQHIR